MLACVDVSAWLTQRGLAARADQILRSLAHSGRGADRWLIELQRMSDGDLHAMAGLPPAMAKQEAPTDFEENL